MAKKKQEYDEEMNKYLNEKDEPMRIEKSNTNLNQAVTHQRNEHDEEEKKISKIEASIKSL